MNKIMNKIEPYVKRRHRLLYDKSIHTWFINDSYIHLLSYYSTCLYMVEVY